MDDFHPDTSFDTINSEHLFQTHQTEDFQISSSLTGTAMKLSERQQRLTTHSDMNQIASLNKVDLDESLIESELKKISKNLNTFTVDHFNTLRQQIQRYGFHHAAQKAKKDFNLITVESATTLMSVGREDHIGGSHLNKQEELKVQN